MDEIESLRRQIQEERRRREAAEQQLEAAEKRAVASEPLSLSPYLEICHTLRLAINIVTDRSLTTQGDTTIPTGRICPRRIVPWRTFARDQEEVWADLATSPSFASRPVFPSHHQLEYVKSLLRPVGSEISLQNGEYRLRPGRTLPTVLISSVWSMMTYSNVLRKRFVKKSAQNSTKSNVGKASHAYQFKHVPDVCLLKMRPVNSAVTMMKMTKALLRHQTRSAA